MRRTNGQKERVDIPRDMGTASEQANFVGYDVEAADGRIGNIDDATTELRPAASTSSSTPDSGSSARSGSSRPG